MIWTSTSSTPLTVQLVMPNWLKFVPQTSPVTYYSPRYLISKFPLERIMINVLLHRCCGAWIDLCCKSGCQAVMRPFWKDSILTSHCPLSKQLSLAMWSSTVGRGVTTGNICLLMCSFSPVLHTYCQPLPSAHSSAVIIRGWVCNVARLQPRVVARALQRRITATAGVWPQETRCFYCCGLALLWSRLARVFLYTHQPGAPFCCSAAGCPEAINRTFLSGVMHPQPTPTANDGWCRNVRPSTTTVNDNRIRSRDAAGKCPQVIVMRSQS